MAFWTYMLHCRGGYFYVGHTDDLERRVAQHQSGAIPGFTADHQPVELVWAQDFPSRDEAKAAERQIKGWSRAKKLALIRGDWDHISRLSKSKDSPSTSSGKTGMDEVSPDTVCPELVEGLHFSLLAHPVQQPVAVTAITVRLRRAITHWLRLRWRVEGSQRLVVPPFAGKQRADGLWQTTCFELFVRSQGETAYAEFNLSPSERWAAYDFASRRKGMTRRPMPRDPVCTMRAGGKTAIFDAEVPLAGLPPLPWQYGLCAVIEEEGGTKSYWALAHPPGRPDFHDPACFAAELPAPGAP